MMNRYTAILLLATVLLTGCQRPKEDYFWYPITLYDVECASGFSGEVYKMTNTIGWRSWPYMLDKSSRREITVTPENCTFQVVRNLPELKISRKVYRGRLTPEQREYLIEGFK